MLRIAPGFVVENPPTLSAALELLSVHGADARLVAGGTDFVPNLKHGLHAPRVLVNLKAVEGLREVDLAGDPLSLGALLGIDALATDAGVRAVLPALSAAAGLIAGPQLRRMGTLGGNVCLDTRCVYINQSPEWRTALGFCLKKDGDTCHVTVTGKKCVAAASNDTAPVLLALGAAVELASVRGTRTVPLEDFYVSDGVKNTLLDPDEVLTRVLVPRPAETRRVGFAKLRVRGAIDYPLLHLAVAFDLRDGVAADAELVVSAVAARPRRVKGLASGALDAGLVAAWADAAHRITRPLSNINADAEWRRDMVPVLVRRAVRHAVEGTGGEAVSLSE